MGDSPLKNKLVLVVDDEVFLREAIIFDLERFGCKIFEAGNGAEALEIVKKNPIDIVVSDVRMPNGDGIFLLKEIRSFHSTVPIVLLCTGFADLTESEAKKMGAFGLLEKPINRKLLFGVLEESVQGAS